MTKISISQFTEDLVQFIEQHPYLKQEDALPLDITDDPDQDRITISFHTVNGEYEFIQVSVDGIP